METDKLKNCPECGEQIPEPELVCCHCGSSLADPAEPAGVERAAVRIAPAEGGSAREAKPANYFVRHWRGELTLRRAYWVNGFAFVVLMSVVHTILSISIDTLSLRIYALLSILLSGIRLTGSIWQIVGVWRSAELHVSRGGKSWWADLAKLVVIISLLRLISGGIDSGLPQTAELVSIIAGDNGVPSYTVRVLPGGTELEFRGGLRAGCAEDLERIAQAVPQAKVLQINSPGGRVSEAKKIMKLVRSRGLTTYASQQCASAATLILMAGKERVVAAGAKVGFHAGRISGATAEMRTEMDRIFRMTMQEAGVSEDFIQHVLATPSTGMWYPSFAEMEQAGVVTTRSLGERFATTWDYPGLQPDQALQRLFGNVSAFNVMRQMEPQAYAKLVSDFMGAVRSGKSEGEALATISANTGSILEKYLPSASDDVILGIRDQWIELLVHYKDKDSMGCLAMLKRSKINYSRALPGWGMTNTMWLVEKAMKSGGARVPVEIDKRAAEQDLVVVRERLNRDYGTDTALLFKESEWKDNSQKVCDIMLSLFRQTATLPKKREVNLIRFLVTSKD